MISAIFYKEYLKTRWFCLILLVANGLLMAFIAIETRQLFVLDHAEMVWYRVLQLGRIHYAPLKYAPVLSGLLLACIQYLPEMTGERLRLSLHLPVSPHRLILTHIFIGLGFISLMLGLDLAALALITARYFPAEAVFTTLQTVFPWTLAGMSAYLGVMLGLLEPNYRLKLFNLVITTGITGVFLFPADPGGYHKLLLFLPVMVLLLIPSVLLPAYRFRYRRVS